MADEMLYNFVRESNRIEGIIREPTKYEINVTAWFIGCAEITSNDMVKLVNVYQPGAVIRNRAGLDVRVGNHVPISGGPDVDEALNCIIEDAVTFTYSAYAIHHQYETLHPFTDGNGRSGRALWLWMMGGKAPLGFLHHWYYQSLDARR